MLKLLFVAIAVAFPMEDRTDCAAKYDAWSERFGKTKQVGPARTLKIRAFCNNLNEKKFGNRRSKNSALFDALKSPFGDLTPKEFADRFHLRENADFIERMQDSKPNLRPRHRGPGPNRKPEGPLRRRHDRKLEDSEETRALRGSKPGPSRPKILKKIIENRKPNVGPRDRKLEESRTLHEGRDRDGLFDGRDGDGFFDQDGVLDRDGPVINRDRIMDRIEDRRSDREDRRSDRQSDREDRRDDRDGPFGRHLQEDGDERPEAPAQCSHLGHTPSRVKAVQDQGGCGSCWAFAIAGACEGTAAVMGFDVKLSESWLLGCTSYDGMDPPAHMGCMGGNMPMIMESIIQMGDTIPDTDLAHPYQPFHDVEQGMNPQCKQNQEYERGVKLVPHSPEMMVVSLSTEYDMKMWLCQRGPLMVALDATHLQNYSGGIIDTDEGCTVADRLNHAVVLVEYTTVGEDHYYKMKNSWGETWGEDGFFRVTTGRECMGLGTVAEVCKPGPVSSDFTPPPTTNSPTTSDSPVTTSPTTTLTTTKPATTVSTTTEATKPSDPCRNPLGEICKRACARGFQFFIDLFC